MAYYDNDTFDAYDENDEPVCVCPEHAGAMHPVFCRACGAYTDEVELTAADAAEIMATTWANAPEIVAPALIATAVYEFDTKAAA
jgi:hypothetical protein